MLAVGFSHKMPFTKLRMSSSILSLFKVLTMDGCWILSSAFSASSDMKMRFLSSTLLTWHITLIIFSCQTNLTLMGHQTMSTECFFSEYGSYSLLSVHIPHLKMELKMDIV